MIAFCSLETHGLYNVYWCNGYRLILHLEGEKWLCLISSNQTCQSTAEFIKYCLDLFF
jgi:hypothetical protein